MEKTTISDRRVCRRFTANNGTMAFFDDVKAFGPVADICLDGISFSYSHTEKSQCVALPLQPGGLVSIIYGKKDFSLGKLKVDVISNVLIESIHTSEKQFSKCRCSLKFKEVTNDQLFLLKRFLLIGTNCSGCYQ